MDLSDFGLGMVNNGLWGEPKVELPPGYSIRWYEEGDCDRWVRIWRDVEQSDKISPERFDREFGADHAVIARRMFFLCDENGQAVATSTAWFEENYHGEPVGRVHWVAVQRSHQGRGLAKPLMAITLRRLMELGYSKACLWTQAHRRAAIGLYLKYGFVPDAQRPEEFDAWCRVLKEMGKTSFIVKRYEPAPYPPENSPSTVHQYLMKRTKQALSFGSSRANATAGGWRRWQRKWRVKLAELTGFDRMPAPDDRPPLRVRSLWKREHEYGTIEKLVMTAEAHAQMPAYLCLPRSVQPPFTPFICLQGHSTGAHNSVALDLATNEKPIEVPGNRDFGIECMKRGMAALCLEQRALGERAELVQKQRAEHNGCHDAVMRALMLGRTVIGERVYDVDRGIDYLATRKDMDLSRLGVMGNSGGGTITIYAAALLARVRAAMASCSFCTFAGSIMSIYHCGDNYVPRIYLWAEMGDILGLFAPRPVVVVAGRHDSIFPIAEVRKAFAQAQAIYKAAGAPGNCQLVVGDGGHRFYADDAWPVMRSLLETPFRTSRGRKPAVP